MLMPFGNIKALNTKSSVSVERVSACYHLSDPLYASLSVSLNILNLVQNFIIVSIADFFIRDLRLIIISADFGPACWIDDGRIPDHHVAKPQSCSVCRLDHLPCTGTLKCDHGLRLGLKLV